MVGIIGAMEDEVRFLRDRLEQPGLAAIGGMEFYTGKIDGREAVILRCGIGKVNAAAGAALLCREFAPALIINTGAAGGIDPSLKFGDAIISTGLVYHDVDISVFGYLPGQIPGCPEIFSVPEECVVLAEKAVDSLKAEKVLPETFRHTRGLIASGDLFMHDPQKIMELKQRFPLVKAVEMEGAAIAHIAFLFGVPAIIIRALSDIAGEEAPVAFEEFLPVAAKHSGEITLRILRDY